MEKTKNPTNHQDALAALWPYREPQAWHEHVQTLNLAQRMHGAMSDLGPMAKDGFAKISGEGGYKYHGHAEISAHVKAALSKWRIAIHVTVAEETREDITIGKYKNPGWLTVARVVVRFINIDKPDEYQECQHVGYGIDSGDKGTGKAVTYAVKYALLKTFMISDGEEPDNEADGLERGAATEPKPASKPKAADAKREYTPIVAEWIDTCKQYGIPAKEAAVELCQKHGVGKLSQLMDAQVRADIDAMHQAHSDSATPQPEFGD